jgi:hypothetical protein
MKRHCTNYKLEVCLRALICLLKVTVSLHTKFTAVARLTRGQVLREAENG